ILALPAFALGGAQSQPDPGLQPHVLMVLSREGTRHGACTGTVIGRDEECRADAMLHLAAVERQRREARGQRRFEPDQRESDEASAGTLRSATVGVLPRLFPRFLRIGTSPSADLSDFAICTGDSGGPVLATGFGGKVIVGVVYGRESFGDARSCGTIGQAVRLAPQAGWIEQNLARWSGEARPRPTR
ncbi:MAG: hypothetical protein ACKODO_12200, partial [Rhabdaerophilum sp.]